MKEEKPKNERKALKLILAMGLLAFSLMLFAASRSHQHRHSRKVEMVETTSNARNLYAALQDFETDYGRFPDATTAEELLEGRGTELIGSSNDYLSQLLIAGSINSEKIFAAPTAQDRQKADNIFGAGNLEETLKAGECGFAYVLVRERKSGLIRGQNLKDRLERPVLVSRMTSNRTFDHEAYGGKAVVLRLDGSATTERVGSPHGKVLLRGGADLFETGPGTVWGEDIQPVVVLPE